MMKFSFQKSILIIAIIVFGIAIWTGDISFKNIEIKNYRHEVQANLQKIQNITGTLYTSPDNSQVAFYNSLGNIEHTLKLQTYEFTEKNIKSQIKKLLEKGVNVQVIMENYKYQQFQNTWKQIEEYYADYPNFAIKSDKQMGTQYVHSKINLVDSGFWIQTANLTHSSFEKNREHFFYSTNPDVWTSLNKIFDKDWIGEKITLEDIHPNLLVCNVNCRDVIELLLESAKKSILIQTQYIVDPNILDILSKKILEIGNKKANFNNKTTGKESLSNIRFVVSDTDSNNDLLKYFGPNIAKKFKKYYNHTKMILIDESILILGSMNLSDNSLDNNREIGIIIVDTKIIKNYKKMFETDWKSSL